MGSSLQSVAAWDGEDAAAVGGQPRRGYALLVHHPGGGPGELYAERWIWIPGTRRGSDQRRLPRSRLGALERFR
ncbi:MAG: hypothetical protein R3F11_20495 [Verrucomicrobiales bacterium]